MSNKTLRIASTAPMSPEDRQLIRSWRRGPFPVLEDLKLEIESGKGIVFAGCGDGHRFTEVLNHLNTCLGRKFSTKNLEGVVHPVTLNGGILCLNKHLPAAENGEDRVMRVHVLDAARNIKQWHTICLTAHWPCGMAERHGISLRTAVRSLITSHEDLENDNPDLQFISLIHCAFKPDNMRTFRVHPGNFAKYLQSTEG